MEKRDYQIIFEDAAKKSILVQAWDAEDAVKAAKINKTHGISMVDNHPGRPSRVYVVEKELNN